MLARIMDIHVIANESPCKPLFLSSRLPSPQCTLVNALAKFLYHLYVPKPSSPHCLWHLILLTASSSSLVPAFCDTTVSRCFSYFSRCTSVFFAGSFSSAVPHLPGGCDLGHLLLSIYTTSLLQVIPLPRGPPPPSLPSKLSILQSRF